MSHPKNILIIGGVAGGMSCATRLRRLGGTAKITVIERGPYVSYANCGISYALGGVIENEAKLHVQTVDKMKSCEQAGKPLSAIALKTESKIPYDKLVLTMGAEAFLPPIEGIHSEHVFTLQTIPDLQKIQAMIDKTQIRRAAVIGGGFIGIEAAENLRRLGLDVTILEYDQHVFPLVDGDIAQVVDDELRKNGVHLMLSARVSKITSATDSQPAEVIAEGADPVPADLVIVGVGVRARTAIAKDSGMAVGRTGVTVNESMQTSDPDIYAVGDMVETPPSHCGWKGHATSPRRTCQPPRTFHLGRLEGLRQFSSQSLGAIAEAIVRYNRTKLARLSSS
ncbi:hypothetical protein EDB81DRAFT_931868 [Dactylonectria macrodidyma]|uniref:FAD/NAD(P)-binding domain-containing protein n=1 Tax=Dactylonectria macrodidyma TaxID=307937 RepID=A0A9P9J8G6_9HYPO|nr:hypothetical protein EDB81DRAFT_931868 [Dactylonectria macrodidyma]